MVNDLVLVSKVLDVLKGAPKPLPISAISRQAGLDRHTVSHLLEILNMSGQIICLHQGAAKKYYMDQNFPHTMFPLASADLIVIVDDALNIIYVNETATQWMKTPIGDLVGKKLDSISHPVLIQPEIFRNLKEADSQRVVHVTLKSSGKDGILSYPVTITKISIPYKETGFLIIIEEAIINNKNAQASLGRELLEQLNPGLIVADLQGVIMYVNLSFMSSLGYSDESDILTHSITDIFSEDSRFIEALVHLGTNNPHFHERSFKKRDGSLIFCLVHWELIKSPSGDPLYISGIMLDLSEREELKDKIVNLEKRYQDIVESTSDVIWETGVDLCYTYVSPAITTLTGYLPRELVGTPPLWLSDKKNGESTIDFWSLLKTSNKCTSAFTKQHSLKHKNGHRVIVDTRAIPILSSAGEFMGYRGIDRDITESTRVREKLRESEKKFRLLTENAQDMIYRMSLPDGKYEYVSPAALQLTGYTPEEYYSDSNISRKLIHADWQEYFKKEFDALLKGNMPPLYEYQIIDRAGKIRWFQQRNTLIKDELGVPVAIEGIVSDITERKQIEDALQESEARFRGITERISDLIIVLDPEGIPTFVSPSITSILGFPPESYIGKMADSDIIHTDDVLKINQAMQNLKNGSPEEEIEFRMLKSDGSYAVFDGRGTPIIKDGIYTGLQVVARNITERKQAEVALKESENRYRTLIENMPDGIILHSPSGKILYANNSVASILHLQDPGELTGKNVLDFVDPDYRDKVSARMEDAIEKGDPIPLKEEVLLCSDGTHVTVENQGCRILFRGEYATQVVVRDITKRKLAEERLRVSEQKYRDIFENSVIGLFQTAPGDRLIKVNNAFARMYGFSDAAELLATNSDVGSPPYANREDRQEVLRILVQKGKIENYETLHCKRDGTRFWVSITAQTIRDNEGNVLLYEGTIIDITKRKLAEDALLREKNYSDRLFDAPHDTVFLFEPSTGKPIRWNKRFSEESGYTDDEIAGMKAPRDFYDKTDLINATEAMARNYTGNVTVELSLVTKQRAHIPFEYSATPIETADGKTLLLSIGRNITKRKQTDENLVATLKRTRDQQAALNEISFSPHLFSGDVHGLSARLTEISSSVLSVERASVWLYNNNEDELRCIDLYEVMYDRHSYKDVLKRREYVNEFDALSKAKFIDADDPLTDPRTVGYVKSYLKPNRITSKLDAVIWVTGQNLGVLCFEHVDCSHHWESDEITFACQLADQIAITLLNRDRKWAEEAINQVSERLTLATHAGGVGIWELDLVNNILIWDDQMFQLYGILPGTFSGTYEAWRAGVHPGDLAQSEAELQLALRGEKEFNNEFRVVWPDKTIHHIHARARVHHDTSGKPIRLLGTNYDVTERKLVEEKLRLSEQKYRDIFENSVVGLFQTAPGGRIINVNDAFARMYGFSDAAEMLAADLDVGSPPYANPDEQQEVRHILAEKGKVENYEALHLKRDGGRFWVSITARIKRDTEGNVLLYEGTVIDITERKRAEEALHESESFNRGLVENLPDYIIVYGQNGNILYVNQAAVRALGYNAMELVGTSMLSYIPEEHREEVISMMKLRQEGREVPAYEIDIVAQGGDHRPVIVKGTQIRYHDSPAFLVLLVDITERKLAEGALALASKKLTLLSGITRHDINNQITILMGYIAILEEQQPDPALKEYFGKVSTAAQRISSMIQFTKEYEKIGVNAPAWQNCRTLVDTAAKQAPFGKIMVKNDLPVGIEVFADPLIVKVCYNLMDNAVRYGGKITTMRFSVEERDGEHVVVCEDDGDGIVAEEKEKIFERGFGKNTGLGLALSREILSITGITIKETGEPGKGARFEMTVPKGAWRIVRKSV